MKWRRLLVGVVAAALAFGPHDGHASSGAAGVPDRNFGQNGEMSFNVAGFEYPTAMAVFPGGAVALALQTSRELIVVKATPTGTPDASFGGRGAVRPMPGKLAGAPALFPTPDGGLLIAAWVGEEVGGMVVKSRFTLVKLRADGTRDPSYGRHGGLVEASLGLVRPLADNVVAASMTSDGGVVVLAVSGVSLGFYGFPSATGVVRFGPNGSVDRSFGIGGFAPVEASPVAPGTYYVATDSRDRVVVGTTDWTLGATAQTLRVLRLTPEGRPDAAFGTAGATLFTLDGEWNSITGLTTDPLDRVVVAGFGADGVVGTVAKALVRPGEPSAGFTPAVARLTERGRLDSSFGSDGIVAVPRDRHGRTLIWSDAIATDATGRAILDVFGVPTDDAGRPIFHTSADDGLSLVRLTTSGSIDNSFDQPRLPMDSWIQLKTYRDRVFAAGYREEKSSPDAYRTVIAAYRN